MRAGKSLSFLPSLMETMFAMRISIQRESRKSPPPTSSMPLQWEPASTLLATSRKMEEGFYAMVSPVMIDKKSPLYSVNGVFNAIFIHGNVLGTQCSTVAEQESFRRPALWFLTLWTVRSICTEM